MPNYDGSVVIGVKFDTAEAEKQLNGLTDDFESVGKSASGFADVLRGNLLSNLIVDGVKTLGSCIKDMAANFIESAASVKAETSQFEQTFGALQTSAEDAIGRVADTSGILETRLNTLGSQIYAFARSSGGSTEESMSLMETALQAAADGAAYYDRSLEDTTATLQSFLKGNYENDAALGLSATETTRNAEAMELFGKNFSDLTEIQKQQTLLQMVLDAQELSGAMGQAAREADGWENVQGNLNEAWRQFMANVGAPLLENLVPIIQSITSGLMEWTSNIDWVAFSDSVNGFVSALVENGPTILSVIAGIGAGFVAWNVVTMIQGVVGAINAFKAANDGLKISQIALNAVMNANPIAIIVTLIAGLVAALITLWNTNEGFRDAVKDIWEAIKGFFTDAWEKIKAVWDVVKTYFQAIWATIKAAFEPVADFLGGVFSAAWDAIKKVWERVSGYFQNVWNTIKGIFSAVKAVLSGDFEGAWEAIKGIVSGWGKYFSGIWDNIKSVFSDAWKIFKDIGGNIVSGIKQGISNAWSSFKDWISGLFGGLVNGVKDLLGIHSPSKVFAKIGDYMMQGLANGVDDGSGLAIKSVKAAAKAAIDAARVPFPAFAFSGDSIPPLSSFKVPRLATGAVVPPNREFMAILGDNKTETEVVSPLSTMKQAMLEALRESGGGTGETVVVLELDGREFGRAVYKANNSESKRIGVSLVQR